MSSVPLIGRVSAERPSSTRTDGLKGPLPDRSSKPHARVNKGAGDLVDAGAPTVSATSRLDVALESLTEAPESWVPVLDNERRVVGHAVHLRPGPGVSPGVNDRARSVWANSGSDWRCSRVGHDRLTDRRSDIANGGPCPGIPHHLDFTWGRGVLSHGRRHTRNRRPANGHWPRVRPNSDRDCHVDRLCRVAARNIGVCRDQAPPVGGGRCPVALQGV